MRITTLTDIQIIVRDQAALIIELGIQVTAATAYTGQGLDDALIQQHTVNHFQGC